MQWRKMGLIYAPSGELDWAQSYALIPTAEVVDNKFIRVYYSSLDKERYGRIGYMDLDLNNPKKILAFSNKPILDLGDLGAFDDSGVNASSIITVNGKKYLYYIGWQRCTRVPYMLFAGLAISDDGIHFEKFSRSPVLGRIPEDPYIRSATTVIYDEGIYKTWYVSGLEWTVVNSVQYPTYIIRYADSVDGINWNYRDKMCIEFKDENEFGFGRPWVIKENNIYKMWYSIRSRIEPYRIGYAESSDGLNWIRKDEEVGIVKSKEGWDSEMICYPCVIDAGDKRYLFYNGNQHGATGFGYAILES